jgi:Secretion system C-terminal sorting domain
MAKYSILIGLYFLASSFVFGQNSTYNLAKSLPYPQGDFTHVIVYEDTIVGYGTGFNNNVDWKQGVVVAKLDTSGNLIAHNCILDAQGDLLATDKAWGNIIRTADGGYAAIAATVGRKSAFLIKMGNDLQVEFIKEYSDTVNLSNYFYKLLETPEGYLLYGSIQRPNYYDDGFIRHVDKQGETIWLKNFDFSQYSTTAVNIQKKTDSTYIASFVSSTNLQENIGFSAFMIFDLNGDQSGFWQFSVESAIGLNRKIIVTNETEIIAFGLYKVNMIGNTPIYQPTLIRFDDQFNPNWISHFGRTGSLNASVLLWDFAPTIDGHYIGAGETLVKDGNDPTRRVGWLYKFSTEGDSIWERKINAPFLPHYYTNSGFFAGVGVLNSGSIIAGGSTNEGNTQYCWLVKVTNEGCLDTLYCQPVSTIFQPANKPFQVAIYPVPASSNFNIKSPVEIRQVAIFDALGKLVLKRQNVGKFITIDLPTSLPTGIYFVEIQDEDGNSIRRKVYINK